MNSRSQNQVYGASRTRGTVLFMTGLVVAAACSSGADGNATPQGQITGDATMQGANGIVGMTTPGAGIAMPGTGMNPIGGNPQAGSGASSDADMQNAAAAMPCAVDMVVKASCQSCHGAMPIGGAPMSLLSLADFTRDYTAKTTAQLKGQTMKMYELARIRVNREMGTTPMPQSGTLAMDAFATLDGWLRSGAPAGAACAVTGGAGSGSTQNPPSGMGQGNAGNGGTTMQPGETATTQCADPKSFEPLVANADENETCWEFQTHGISSPTDKSKFTVPPDESYSQFYFDVPWEPGSLSTRFGSDFDNLAVLHHWLMFSQAAPTAAGTVSPNVTGTTLFEGAELLAGWAVGGCATTYPKDVGVALPDGGTIMIQWHHFNSTGASQKDGTKVQICTVPAGSRPHVAGLTFLGTEALVLPPGRSDAISSCQNNSGAPITIVGFTPHMHTIGANMKSVVDHQGGASEPIFDKPFVFDQQINYMLSPLYVLQPGDAITTTCTFDNNTDLPVTFGQSTTQEMCYQFTLAYPYGALNNGVVSLIGATNTCW